MGQEREVRSWMSHPVATIDEMTPAQEAWAQMEQQGLYHLLVTKEGRPRGVVCGCDLARAPGDAPVWRCMSSPAVVVLASADVESAAALLDEAHVGCLPVVSRKQVIGIVTRSDLRRAGALPPLESQCCSACGGTHHLRVTECELVLCVSCREQAAVREPDSEIGVGD
jgi:signal-transduction protein with cAMP-binding, CBS, and nucleotidyltransferase domain